MAERSSKCLHATVTVGQERVIQPTCGTASVRVRQDVCNDCGAVLSSTVAENIKFESAELSVTINGVSVKVTRG